MRTEKEWIKLVADLEDRAQKLDLRRQDQIQRQIDSINRMKDAAAHLREGIVKLHFPVRVTTETVLTDPVTGWHCNECTGKEWPCATAKLFELGSALSFDAGPVAETG